MGTALEVVKEAYKCFSEGDLDGCLGLCSENIEWVVNGPATLKKCRAFKGLIGVREYLEILGNTWEYRSFTAKQFITEGNTVVALGEETGHDKMSGSTFENRWAHVFDIEGGRIVRFREFLCHWTDEQKPPEMSW